MEVMEFRWHLGGEDQASVAAELQKFLGDKFPDAEITPTDNCLSLRLESDAGSIEKLRNALGKFEPTVPPSRHEDSLSDSLSIEAYPILASIESELRRFCSRAFSQQLGPQWWVGMTTKVGSPWTDGTRISKGRLQAIDPLDAVFFADLVAAVTCETSEWSPTNPIPSHEILTLLLQSTDYDDLKKRLHRKLETQSIWEDVFSLYFEDEDTWDSLAEDLTNLVIPIRNDVMHHRPILRADFDRLKSFADAFETALAKAKDILDPEVQDIAEETARDLVRTKPGSILLGLDPKALERMMNPLAGIDPKALERMMNPLAGIDPDTLGLGAASKQPGTSNGTEEE